MELSEYTNISKYISSNIYPDHLLDTSSKAAKNRRDNFKAKAKKFFLKGDELYRFVPGNVDGVKVVLQDQVPKILGEFHGSAFGGHSGVNKTREAITSRYWWFGLTDDVKKYISSCHACQKSDPLKPAKKPELQQIKVKAPFELVGVDLIGPLKETEQGNKYIFTATDYFTKWVEAFPIKNKSAKDVSQCFKQIFARHGAVNAILSDQGREFVNQVNDQLCKEWNVERKMTAAYHPQTNGLDEKTNQTIKNILRKLVNEHQDDWDIYLDGALFSIRSKPHCSTKYSPFFLLYGREAVYPSQLPQEFSGDVDPVDLTNQDAESYVERREAVGTTTNEKVQQNQEKAHKKQQKDYKKRTTCGREYAGFKKGDEVLVFNSKKTPSRKGNLQANYLGPFKILEVKGKKARLCSSSGELKTSYNIDHLKHYQQHSHDDNKIKDNVANSSKDNVANSSSIDVEKFVSKLQLSGDLENLRQTIESLDLTHIKGIHQLKKLLTECPIQTFVAEVSKEYELQMDAFASAILPYMRTLPVDLATKTTITMVLACICTRSAMLSQSPFVIAETLRKKPSHLAITVETTPMKDGEKMSVGGETITNIDLQTLDKGQWLNDKVINSYLNLLKKEQNNSDLHIFVLPSYTAVLWENGHIDQWLFKRVKFSVYRYIFMPINVNNSHWILMVACIPDMSVCVYDSKNGNHSDKWINLWRNFITRRNMEADEQMGHWTSSDSTSSTQTDGNSCGVFTLMNAECIAKGIPPHVFRQVHTDVCRQYILERLMMEGSTKAERICDLPGCIVGMRSKKFINCCVCGRWLHHKCAGVKTLSPLEQDIVCCICVAMYS